MIHPFGPSPCGSRRFALQSTIAAWIADLALARYVRKRASKHKTTICRRRSDRSLWAATAPQNAGYAMRGMFSGKSSWHFAKVRFWRGLPIVSPKVFWTFNEFGKFDIVEKDAEAFWLAPWPEAVECEKIDAGCGR